MRSPGSAIMVLMLAAFGCADRPADTAATPPDSLPVYLLRGVPVMPGVALRAVEGARDAVQAVALVPLPPDSVARWYRRTLIERDWRITGDVPDRAGGTTLHATSPQGTPVWLLISPDGSGTQLLVVGAQRDTAAAGGRR